MVSKLTQSELKVLDLVQGLNLDVKTISKRRHTKVSQTYKILRKLKQKGWLKRDRTKRVPPIAKKRPIWRYHNLHFLITPTYKYPRFKRHIGVSGVQWRAWTMKINKDIVELQLKSGEDFEHANKFESTRMAQESFNRVVFELGNKYGFETFKEGKANIRQVNGHLALYESGIAKALKKEYIRIRNEKGRTWFMIDTSKGRLEHEYVDPQEHVIDAEIVEPYFNDWRENKPLTNSELQTVISSLAQNTQLYVKNIALHLGVLKSMDDTLKKINRELKTRSEKRDLKKQHTLLSYF